MAEKYIYVEGKKIYVSGEVYREYKKHKILENRVSTFMIQHHFDIVRHKAL